MQYSFETSLNVLKALALFVSTDSTRYPLSGIHIEMRKGRMTAVATDGRRMLIIDLFKCHSGMPDDGGFILPPPDFARLGQAINDSITVRIDTEAKSVDYIATWVDTTTISLRLVDAAFPDWRKVIDFKEGNPLPGIYVNGGFFGDFIEAARLISGQQKAGLKIQQAGAGGPYNITTDVAEFYGILMPMRDQGAKYDEPPVFGLPIFIQNIGKEMAGKEGN